MNYDLVDKAERLVIDAVKKHTNDLPDEEFVEVLRRVEAYCDDAASAKEDELQDAEREFGPVDV